jgi:hydroxymethylglutaryl-CoA lyase
MGIDTGVDLEALLEAGRIAQSFVGAELPSKVLKSGPRYAVSGSD